MMAFRGRIDATDKLTWKLPSSIYTQVTVDTSYGYRLFSDSTQWINCDRFLSNPTPSAITITPVNCPDLNNTMVLVHYTNRKIVVPATLASGKFLKDKLLNAPVTIVAFCVSNDKFYSALPAFLNLPNGSSITATFKETTEAQLRADIAALQ